MTNIILQCRNISKGRSALANFCMIMDMPPPVLRDSYSTHVSEVWKASIAVYEETLQSQAESFGGLLYLQVMTALSTLILFLM